MSIVSDLLAMLMTSIVANGDSSPKPPLGAWINPSSTKG
jgi:hypothetical protein